MSRRQPSHYLLVPVGSLLVGLLLAIVGCSGDSSKSLEVAVPGLTEPMYFIAGAEPLAALDAESKGEAAAELQKGLNLVKAGKYGTALPVFVSLAQAHSRLAILNNLGVVQAANGSPGSATSTDYDLRENARIIRPIRDDLKKLKDDFFLSTANLKKVDGYIFILYFGFQFLD